MKPLAIPYNINGQQRSPSLAPGLFEPLAKPSSFETNTLPNIVEEIPENPPQGTDCASGPASLYARTSNKAGSPDFESGSGRGGSVSGSGSSDNDTYVTRPTTASSLAETPIQERDMDEGDLTLDALLEDYDLDTTVDDVDAAYSLEAFSDLLFSSEHLKSIFGDTSSLLSFTAFLSEHRPHSLPILIYYLDTTKALRAFRYANAIAEGLGPITGHDFTSTPAKTDVNPVLVVKAQQSFNLLLQQDLPAYVTHMYVQVANSTMIRRVTTGTISSNKHEPEGLAEVFCLTEPTRPDNPIVFVSEAFHQMTQYGVNYTIGRNCRFLQGPKTNPASVRRLRRAVEAGLEHCEVILNYRRDGSPFMNLLMHAPLCDSSGKIRYHLGAQVDVSSVFKDGVGLESLQRVIEQQQRRSGNRGGEQFSNGEMKTTFQQLSEMFDTEELRTVQDWGRRTSHASTTEPQEPGSAKARGRGMVLRDPSFEHLTIPAGINMGPKFCGYYAHYMLVRPYPTLRILFAAPSLRVHELVQSPIMDKIGGSVRVRDELLQALAAGRGVTARIRWILRADEEGRRRWIHFTPLLRKDGQIGVWVVILVDDEEMQTSSATESPNLDTQRETETTFPSVASPIPLRQPERNPHRVPPVTVTPPIVPARDHRVNISWSGPEVAPELRHASLHWVPEKKFETPMDDTMSIMTISSSITAMTEATGHSGMSGETADDEVTFDSIEERLRKKRARDARRMVAGVRENGSLTARKTYKSLSPYSFMEAE